MRTAPGEIVIETGRLILRNWRSGDAELFDRHCNTESVMRWLGGVQSRASYDEVAARLARWQAERGFTFWVVERKADGAFLGFCGIKIADGARLREDVWGQGYAREAASAALAFAFGTLGVERVVALTVAGNAASWGLMLRLGMTRRADLDYTDPRWPGSMNPVIVYEMERDGWKA
jgi:RimJ/RimL family protein N-acetyltransferase